MPHKDREKRREYMREYQKRRRGRPPMKRGSWMIGEKNVSKRPEVIAKIKAHFRKEREKKDIYDTDVIKMYLEDKLSKREIAKKYKCDSSVISGILKENKIEEYPVGHFRLGKSPPNKLNLDNKSIADIYVNQDKSSKEIAKEFKCNVSVILRILKKEGIELKQHGYFNYKILMAKKGRIPKNKLNLDEKEIIRLYIEEKMTPYAMSKNFGCHASTIIRVLNENNVKRFPQGFFQELKGIKNRDSSFSQIKSLYDKCMSCKDIGNKLNRTYSFISKVLRQGGVEVKKGGLYNIGKESWRRIKNLDETKIIDLYENQLKGMGEIGKIIGCSSPVIANVLKRNNINTSSKRRQKLLFERGIRLAHNKKDLEELKVIDLYLNKKQGMNKIAKVFNCDSCVIKRILSERGIEIHYLGFRDSNGEKNPNWKGGIQYEPYDSNFSPEFKEEIRNRDKFICLGCGRTQEDEIKEFKQKLCIHHIDFNKKNTTPLNCCATCIRCNILANYDRTRWEIFYKERLRENYGYNYEKEVQNAENYFEEISRGYGNGIPANCPMVK